MKQMMTFEEVMRELEALATEKCKKIFNALG